MQKCQYNEPDAFDPEAISKFAELRKLRLDLEQEKKNLINKKAWKGSHPWDIAVKIQQLKREIDALFDQLKPRPIA